MQHVFHSSALRRTLSRRGLSTIDKNHDGTATEWDLGLLETEIQENINRASEGNPRTEVERAVEMLAERLG